MLVGVIGTGYVGLVTGACLAELGVTVLCGDTDGHKIAELKSGKLPIYEPGLKTLVRDNTDAGRLSFTEDLGELVRLADVIFITVGTPQGKDGSANINNILEVASVIGEELSEGKVIVTKSTVPVGTSEKIRERIEKNSDAEFHLCSNPEFLREGSAVYDFMNPDRVILGVDSDYAGAYLRHLYAPIVKNTDHILIMDLPSAEMTKYAANAMLATRISFINSIAALCRKKNADIEMVSRGVGTDSRIGESYLNPGAGYGGSCFSKDIQALLKMMADEDLDPSIFSTVEEVNERQKTLLYQKVIERLGKNLTGKKIAIWGLSFKPDTDDMRAAPSLVTIEALLEHAGSLAAHDPKAIQEARKRFGKSIEFSENQYEILSDASALVVHTEWDCYRHADFEIVKSRMKQPIVIDGRGLYDQDWLCKQGFEYYSLASSFTNCGQKE